MSLRIGQNLHPMSENFCKPAIGMEGREDAICVFPSGENDDTEFVRLFAAAPELLSACKAVLARLDDLPGFVDVKEMLSEAIQKAERK